MQLKIIVEHGQCRGHPPIRGSGRDGPGSSKFKVQSSKFEVQSSKFEVLKSLVNLRVLSALVVRRRWGERVGSWQLTVDSQSAVSGQQSAVWNLVRQLVDGTLKLWNIGTKELWKPGTVSSQQSAVSSKNIRPSTAVRRPPTNARDWISYTCSVGPQITRYRYKYRSGDTEGPAIVSGAGEVCLEIKN